MAGGPAGRLRALGLEGQHWGWGACGCEWVPAGHIITSNPGRHRSTSAVQRCCLTPDQAEQDGDVVHPEPHQAQGQVLSAFRT